MTDDGFGDWLRREREAKRLTQQQLAELAGVSGQQISNIEVGRTTRPQEATRKKLIAALASQPSVQPVDNSSPIAAPAPAVSAHFQIVREVGRGAYGTVYEGRDLTLGRRVAIKIVRESGDAVLTALGQARVLARASHPNIIIVHSVVRIEDPETGVARDAIVMEFVEGQKLGERLKGPPLTVEDVRTIGLGLIDGLAHLHGQGLVHQDLHENNVLLVGAQAKLIDPMHLTTLAKLSETARDGRIRRDLANLRALLGDVLAHSTVPSARRDDFFAAPERGMSLEDIRRSFGAAFANDETTLDASDKGATAEGKGTSTETEESERGGRPEQPDGLVGRSQHGSRRNWARAGAAVIAIALAVSVGVWFTGGRRMNSIPPPDTTTRNDAGPPSATPNSTQQLPSSNTSTKTADLLPPAATLNVPERRDDPPEMNCAVPPFIFGAARRYVAVASTEEAAKFIRKNLGILLKSKPNGEVWTTALQYYDKQVSGKPKWVVAVHSMNPSSARAFCRWLLECQGWTEICTDTL